MGLVNICINYNILHVFISYVLKLFCSLIKIVLIRNFTVYMDTKQGDPIKINPHQVINQNKFSVTCAVMFLIPQTNAVKLAPPLPGLASVTSVYVLFFLSNHDIVL